MADVPRRLAKTGNTLSLRKEIPVDVRVPPPSWTMLRIDESRRPSDALKLYSKLTPVANCATAASDPGGSRAMNARMKSFDSSKSAEPTEDEPSTRNATSTGLLQTGVGGAVQSETGAAVTQKAAQ